MNILVTGAFKGYETLAKEKPNNNYIYIQNELEMIRTDVSRVEYVICNGLFLKNDISKFKSLRYIQVTSAGLDRLPLKYIDKHNITVYNARGVYSIPMAEWVVCKILDVYKKSEQFFIKQRTHTWAKEREIEELNNKTAVIVGYGNVGQEIAKRLIAFGVKILTIDKDNFKELSNIIPKSNIIILTLPLTKETEGIFNKNIIELINNKPILVNVARGKIINEQDIIKYHKKFEALIFDVFEEEPLSQNNELWNLKNAIITPHNSFVGQNNENRLYQVIKQNLEKASTGINQ